MENGGRKELFGLCDERFGSFDIETFVYNLFEKRNGGGEILCFGGIGRFGEFGAKVGDCYSNWK